MELSWERDARRSPVPRRPAQRPRSRPSDWNTEVQQDSERAACKKLEADFLGKLSKLTQEQEDALASSFYLDEPAFHERLAGIKKQRSQLTGEYEQALRTAAGSLPEDNVSAWCRRFSDACDKGARQLQKDADAVTGIIQRRGVIEHAHAERAGLMAAADPPGTAPSNRHAVALGVIHGMALMACGQGGTGTAASLVAAVAEGTRALASATRLEPGGDLAIAAPVDLADGRFSLDLAAAASFRGAAQDSAPDCTVLEGPEQDGPFSHTLVYLVDMQGRDQPEDGVPRHDAAPAGHAHTSLGAAGIWPAVGVVIRGPASSVSGGRRILNADAITSFARSIIFREVYEGTPQAAAAAMRAAQALEVVALVDPGMNGGVWADVNPPRQVAAATLLIEGRADGRLRFLGS